MKNTNLNKAKRVKDDEFYTKLSTIENEIPHYASHFNGKTVYCNCDDPRISEFFTFFTMHFHALGLKKLITTCYKNEISKRAIHLEYSGDKVKNWYPNAEYIGFKDLKGDGDFRSSECIELLKESDIVVTNPPFSLFREYVAQLIQYEKKFLILGNFNAITYKEIFALLNDNTIWLGHSRIGKDYFLPDGTKKYVATYWYTNMSHKRRNKNLTLTKTYNEKDYPKYDTYDAINVDKVKDIPKDYDGVIGVPISFLDKHNPDQFELLGIDRYIEDNPHYGRRFRINGKEQYARILIRRKIQPMGAHI